MKPYAPVLSFVLAWTGGLHAATLYWDGDSSTVNAASDNTSIAPMNWLSGGNWDNGASSASLAAWTANDAAVLGGAPAGTQTVTLGAPVSLSNLDIGPGYLIAVNTGAYNSLGIPSGPVIVGAGSTISANNAANNAHNIGALTLNGGTLTSVNGPGGTANDGGFGNWLLQGDVTVGGAAASTISSTTLALARAGGPAFNTFTVGDVAVGDDLIVTSQILGTKGLQKEGAGTLRINSINAYTGGTVVNAGVLSLGAGGASGAIRGVLTVNQGGTVVLDAGNSVGYQASRVTTFNLNGGTLTAQAANVDNGWAAAWNLAAGASQGATINGGGRLTFGGGSTIGTSGDFQHTISAYVRIREGNTPNGLTITTAGGAAPVDLLVSGVVEDGGGARGLFKAGAGVLRLSGANTYTGGTTVNAGTLELAYSAGDQGTLRNGLVVNAGATVALKAVNALGYLGNNWMRTITLNGGTLRTDVSGDNGWGTTISLTRGTMSAGVANGYFSMGNAPVFNVTGDTAASVISANLTVRDQIVFNVARGTDTTDLNITGRLLFQTASGITKNGDGIMALSGANTYAGVTAVNAGTLRIDGSNLSTAGLITVSAGATLGGSGSMGDVTVLDGGILAPGGSAGAISLRNLTLAPDASLHFELGAPNLGLTPTSDRIAIQQTLELDGHLSITPLPAFTAAMGDRWLLMTYGEGLADSTLAIVNPGPDAGLSYAIDITTNGEVYLVVVPESATAALLLLGLAGLLRHRLHRS
jgi:fibronectin-binding autotransporter adhesin